MSRDARVGTKLFVSVIIGIGILIYAMCRWAATSVALAAVMGKRFQSSGKVMPAGALTILAGIYSVLYSSSLMRLTR